MKGVDAVVNFIKSSTVNSRLFEQMCVDFESEFQHLFYFNVRWLSRGKLLRRAVDLRTELHIFLKEKNHRHAIRFQDEEWMPKVCYLNNIFIAVNEVLNVPKGDSFRDRGDLFVRHHDFQNIL